MTLVIGGNGVLFFLSVMEGSFSMRGVTLQILDISHTTVLSCIAFYAGCPGR